MDKKETADLAQEGDPPKPPPEASAANQIPTGKDEATQSGQDMKVDQEASVSETAEMEE